MRRFLFNKENIQNGKVVLEGQQAHHLINVLRMESGEYVVLIDKKYGSFKAKILSIQNKKVFLETARELVRIALFQSLLPKGRMDKIIGHLTEIGISLFVPIRTERCVPRLNQEQSLVKRQRWEKIASESAKQCGCQNIPEIFPVIDFKDALIMAKDTELILMPTLTGIRVYIADALKQGSVLHSVSIFIGPEGDWTEGEIKMGLDVGAVLIDLGENVLRPETAAVYITSILKFFYSRS